MKKRVLGKSWHIIRDRAGLGLAESIVCIFVFTIIMAAVALMIAISIRITGLANAQAQERQNEANAVIIGESYDPSLLQTHNDRKVSFIIRTGLSAQVDVTVYSTESWGFAAFKP